MVRMNGVPRLSLVLAGLLLAGCGGGGAGGKGGSGGGMAGSSGGAIGGSGGGGTAGTEGGATAGIGGGVAGTTGSGGSVTSAEVKAAVDACAWTTGCFNTEDSQGTQCTSERGACTGNTYQGCLSGYNIDVDCAALGGTCGVNRAGRPSCVFPEGTGGSGAADGGTGGAGGSAG